MRNLGSKQLNMRDLAIISPASYGRLRPKHIEAGRDGEQEKQNEIGQSGVLFKISKCSSDGVRTPWQPIAGDAHDQRQLQNFIQLYGTERQRDSVIILNLPSSFSVWRIQKSKPRSRCPLPIKILICHRKLGTKGKKGNFPMWVWVTERLFLSGEAPIVCWFGHGKMGKGGKIPKEDEKPFLDNIRTTDSVCIRENPTAMIDLPR